MRNLLWVFVVLIAGICNAHTARSQCAAPIGCYVREWTVPGSPEGVAVDASGRVWVSSAGDHHVRVYSPGGTLVDTFGGFGTGPGQFDTPVELVPLADGSMLVGDYLNHRIQKLSATGVPLTAWNVPGSRVSGMGLDADGNLYAANFTGPAQGVPTSTIHKFSPLGILLLSWSTPSYANGLVVHSGVVYVNCVTDGLTRQYSLTGELLGSFASPAGTGAQHLSADRWGQIFMTDYEHDAIHVLQPGGGLIGSMVGSGAGPGQFDGPHDCFIDEQSPARELYVADALNNRVQVFQLGPTDTKSTTWGRLKSIYW